MLAVFLQFGVTLTSGMERGGDRERGKGKECWRTPLMSSTKT